MKTHSRIFAALALLSTSAVCFSQTADKKLPYLNPKLPVAQRVADLVSRMTLEEKVSQMQNGAAAIPRLDVPAYNWWSEALHGVAFAGYATVFPQAIGMAATWDKPLVHEEGEVISTEGRAKFAQSQAKGNRDIFHGLTFWSPNINIFRDPRWGRGQETYGEDPFLTANMGVAFIKGMQGNNPEIFKVIATAKHFDVHSGPESTRHKANVNASPHDLEDTYTPAFRAAMVVGKADSIMCSYNAVDGTPACANTMLLADTLRKAWGFKGYVVSDCDAVDDMYSPDGHHYAPDAAHAAADAVKAGTDLDCGTTYAALVQAVHEKLLSEADINQSVTRLFTARFDLGLFNPPGSNAYQAIPASENMAPAHGALALKAAQEAIVLLKNDGVLPLKKSIKTIALVGPDAEDIRVLEGNYNGVPKHPVTPLEGIEKRFRSAGVKVLYEQGAPQVTELPVVVPSSAFVGGLQAEYFGNKNFSGSPVAEKDSHIDFDWTQAAPVAVPDAKGFSVRWKGSFHPVAAGDQSFTVQLSNYSFKSKNIAYKVFFGDKQVAELSSGDSKLKSDFTVHFDNTNPVPFRMEYAWTGGGNGVAMALKWQPPVDALRAKAVAIAKQADVVVAVVGLSPALEGEEMPVHIPGFSGGDRTDIALPAVQKQLLEALGATGKPLVVVLTSGSAVAMDWAAQHAGALVEAWYPGQSGGTAIADVLAGDTNPAGRLPVTFYKSISQLPAFDDYNMQNRTYRYFHGEPLYGFGYGLSYSTFAYRNLKLSSDNVTAGSPLHVDVDVQNTSAVPGDEVAELYLTPPSSSINPQRWLAGFKRVHVGAHQTQHVSFDIDPRSLSLVDAKGNRAVMPGKYTVFVGGAQPWETKTGVQRGLSITGTKQLPR